MIAAAMVFCTDLSMAARPNELPPLNDIPTGEHLNGKFVWADLFTTDPTVAGKFYCDLLGWTEVALSRDNLTTYILLSNLHGPVAGVVQRPAGRPDGPARWISYVSVDDVSRVLAAVTTAGGRTLASPRDLPQRGTQALIADKDGAALGILHSTLGDPGDYWAEPGDWIWAELLARQPQAAGDFYRSVFNYGMDPDARTNKKDHFILSSLGFARAGIAPMPAEKDAKPGWLGFVRVDKLDETVNRAIALGGKVLVEPRPTELASRFAVIADPTGGAMGLVELENNLIAKVQP